jgi:ABC-type uncharacterized transport system permease subunit
MVGDSADAARALGYSVNGVRIAATAFGGFIAGLGGASLSLSTRAAGTRPVQRPGPDRGGAGDLRALEPRRCLLGAACCSAAPAPWGPALQSVGVGGYYHLFNAVPYVLTLAVIIGLGKPGPSTARRANSP